MKTVHIYFLNTLIQSCYWKWNFPISPSVGWWVGLSYFPRGAEVPLPCPNQRTCSCPISDLLGTVYASATMRVSVPARRASPARSVRPARPASSASQRLIPKECWTSKNPGCWLNIVFFGRFNNIFQTLSESAYVLGLCSISLAVRVCTPDISTGCSGKLCFFSQFTTTPPSPTSL